MPLAHSPRAPFDLQKLEPVGFCDRCAFKYPLASLVKQRAWSGPTVITLDLRVCPRCLDELNPQFRTIVIDADPKPLKDPRPGIRPPDLTQPTANFVLDDDLGDDLVTGPPLASLATALVVAAATAVAPVQAAMPAPVLAAAANYFARPARLALSMSEYPGVPPMAFSKTGILLPYYFYTNNPYTDPVFTSLLALVRQYHQVPVLVIINQPGSDGNGGPGPYDGNIAAAIRLLQGAGASALGYVATNYANRAESAVKADVALWNSLYTPPPDGIFFDEMPYDTGAGGANVALYQRYYAYAQGLGFAPVVGNPGSDEQPAWYATKTADIIVINENSSWPSTTTVAGNFTGGHADYDYRMNAILVYGQASFNSATFQSMQPYVQWVYVTSNSLPNPWSALPSYLPALFAACAA